MKKIYLVCAWTLLLFATISVNAVLATQFIENAHNPTFLSAYQGAKIATSDNRGAQSSDSDGIQTTLAEGDARIPIVTNFLRRHESPLQPYEDWGKKLVAIADKYRIDFRLLPAIAMQESNLCKVIPAGTYNCLGFGIDKYETLGFDSYEAMFDRAARTLKQNYIDDGLTTPEKIMEKYTPSSDGSWASSVNQWIAEMKYDDHAKGLELKTNADMNEFVAGVSTSSAQTTQK